MQSVVQNTKEKGDGILYLHIWKGKEASAFTYYEDDGITYEYEKGQYYKRTIRYEPGSGKLTLEKKSGSYSSKFKKVKIVLHGFDGVLPNLVDLNDDLMVIDLK